MKMIQLLPHRVIFVVCDDRHTSIMFTQWYVRTNRVFANWCTGVYVEDRIRRYRQCLGLHMPTMKMRQPTSGPWDLPSLMVFTAVADVREVSPERGRGAKCLLLERPLLSLIYRISPRDTGGGLVEAPPCHIRINKSARQGLGQTCPRPRQGRHHH